MSLDLVGAAAIFFHTWRFAGQGLLQKEYVSQMGVLFFI